MHISYCLYPILLVSLISIYIGFIFENSSETSSRYHSRNKLCVAVVEGPD